MEYARDPNYTRMKKVERNGLF